MHISTTLRLWREDDDVTVRVTGTFVPGRRSFSYYEPDVEPVIEDLLAETPAGEPVELTDDEAQEAEGALLRSVDGCEFPERDDWTAEDTERERYMYDDGVSP